MASILPRPQCIYRAKFKFKFEFKWPNVHVHVLFQVSLFLSRPVAVEMGAHLASQAPFPVVVICNNNKV